MSQSVLWFAEASLTVLCEYQLLIDSIQMQLNANWNRRTANLRRKYCHVLSTENLPNLCE